MERIQDVGLYSRTDATADLRIVVTVTRFDPRIKTIRLRASNAVGGGTIGGIRETVVTFRKDTVRVIARVQHALAKAVVERIPVTWNWFMRFDDAAPWTPLGQSTRRVVYTTVGAPTLPWGVHRSKYVEIPWRNALDWACRWAHGATNVEQICRRITEAVYGSPGGHLTYSPRDASGPYTSADTEYGNPRFRPWFDCALLLSLLNTGKGHNLVCCSDVASIVCTLSNLLGADLYEDKMIGTDHKGFRTVKVRGIGWKRRDAQPLRIQYHEVAWNTPGGDAQPVWDASFGRLVGRTEQLAIRVRFRDYRRLVVSTRDQGLVSHDPAWPMRRRLLTAPIAEDVFQSSTASLRLSNWTCEYSKLSRLSPDVMMLNSLWLGHRDPNNRRINIQVLGFRRRSEAKRALNRLKQNRFNPLKRLYGCDFAEEVLAGPGKTGRETLIYFLRGNLVCRVSSSGFKSVTVRHEAKALARRCSELSILMQKNRAPST